MDNTNIESKVASAILQRPKVIFVGKKKYKVSKPSTATILLVSEAISQLPQEKLDANNLLYESLRIGKDCAPLGRIAAILIVGAKKYNAIRVNRLARRLLLDLSPKELNALVANLLGTQEIGDFFGLTTSLIEVNIMKPKKAIGTTVSGQ